MLETERRRKGKRCKRLGCVQPRFCSVWVHRTVQWLTGQCPVVHRTVSGGAPDSVRCARLARANWPLSGIHRRRTTIIHRTVWCAPDCPVSQRSAGPTVGRAICTGHVAEPTTRWRHRTVRCAPDMSGAPTAPRLPTVGFTIEGKKSGTGQCPVCTGLSGAPPDKKLILPSK
jgi:hypothetical protein